MYANRLSPVQLAVAATITGLTALSAHAATWVPTAAGNQDWQIDGNWSSPATHPDGAGAVADITADLAGDQTIRLNGDRTIGTLIWGDSGAAAGQSKYIIAAGSPAGKLIFQGATAGSATTINLTGTATLSPSYASNTISANVQLGGTSPLTINQNGAQNFMISGTTDMNGNTLTIAGSGAGYFGFSLVSGTGSFVKNNTSALNFAGTSNTYTGSLTLNKGNTTVTGTSSISTFGSGFGSAVTLNGVLSTTSTTQNGGSLSIGDNSASSTNPGQRLPTAGVTLNGGTVGDAGQALKDAALNTLVTDTIAVLDFNSAYSRLNITATGSSAGTTLNVTALQRGDGATASVTSSSLAGTPNGINKPSKVLVSNISGFLKGSGGSGTSQSIIPWMTANNVNASASNVIEWATYGANGIVALDATGYATMSAASATDNVKDSAALGNNVSKTINSLHMNLYGTPNIGSNSTLTVTSGAVLIANDTRGIGVAGNAAAGTLNFGSAEGVVWAGGANTNYIGAVLAGSGGLTKAGTGTLVLQGANTFTGDTFVSAGTLRVGDGTYASILGDGDVSVANGAILRISSAGIIPDSSILSLDAYGLFNGMVSLDTGINETVGGLKLAGIAQGAGTYGSTASAALYKNDTYFTGAGILTVVPEPASLGVLAIGGLLLGARRRRR